MAFTRADIATLEQAIAKGVRSVQFAERRVEYQSTKDMLAALDKMRSDLNKRNQPRIVRYYHAGKGVR